MCVSLCPKYRYRCRAEFLPERQHMLSIVEHDPSCKTRSNTALNRRKPRKSDACTLDDAFTSILRTRPARFSVQSGI
jgi:hypothetical protein